MSLDLPGMFKEATGIPDIPGIEENLNAEPIDLSTVPHISEFDEVAVSAIIEGQTYALEDVNFKPFTGMPELSTTADLKGTTADFSFGTPGGMG